MENTEFDINKVGEEIARQRQEIINNYNVWAQRNNGKRLIFIEMRHIGKIKVFDEEKGKEIELETFISVEQIGEEFQYVFCAQNDGKTIMLGIKKEQSPVAIGINFLGARKTTQEKLVLDLEGKMKEVQKEQSEQPNSKAKDGEESQVEHQPDENQIPTRRIGDIQLTKEELDSMPGPKVPLNQEVDEQTLGIKIGVSGEYMKFISADTLRRLYPDVEIPANCKNIPFGCYSNGEGIGIGEDKLKLSSQEENNFEQNQTTITNDGEIKTKKNIETYNIVTTAGVNTIEVGYNENDGTPLEVRYGRRDNKGVKISTDLLTIHEGKENKDSDAQEYQEDNSNGQNKAAETIEMLYTITTEVKLRYAIAKGLYMLDEHGFRVPNRYNLDEAERQIREDGRTIPEILEELEQGEGIKLRGPHESPRPH